jgi:methionyl-tRNA formyltransferase
MSPREQPKIAFFGTPSRFSHRALEQLVARWSVVAVVLPAYRGLSNAVLRKIGLRRPSDIERLAHKANIPLVFRETENPDKASELVRRARPDLICVASFPKLIPPDVIGAAPLGAINLHPSLLPRHRGPLPLFWTYHADDRSTGVTVHQLTERFDAGDIILQHAFPLSRGYPVARLDEDVAVHGAMLFEAAVAAIAAGTARPIAQDEGMATMAPRVRRGSPMVNFDEWDVERVWHFLTGLGPGFREPLKDHLGKPVSYNRTLGFERGAARTAGSVDTVDSGWRLHCRDGIVLLGR